MRTRSQFRVRAPGARPPRPRRREVARATISLASYALLLGLLANLVSSGVYAAPSVGPSATTGVTPNAATSGGNEAANLDQCADGGVGTPKQACTGANWQNGNLNGNQAQYKEGESIPYRMKLSNLTGASHGLTIQWDTTKSGKHAIDYITTWDRSVMPTSNPCDGVSGCQTSASATYHVSTMAIPQQIGTCTTCVQSGFTNKVSTQVPGVITLYGGTITSVSAYSATGTFPGGDSSVALTINFTADVSNPVVAWGGHIASQIDWGGGSGAGSISGSPFHTRLVALDGGGGNQDRALATSAVATSFLTTVKQTSPAGSTTSFTFGVAGGPSGTFSGDNFSLSGVTANNANTHTTGPLYSGSYTDTESNNSSGWRLTALACSSANGGSSGSSTTTLPSATGGTATVSLGGGDTLTCTFTNTANASVQITKTADASPVNAGDTIGFTMNVTNTGAGTATNVVVTDRLPTNSGLSWSISSGSTPSGAWTITNGVLTGNLGTLAPSGAASVHITSATTANTCGTVSNTASYTSDNAGSGNTPAATVTVNCPALTITKTADASTVSAGSPIGFTITLSNSSAAGTGTAEGVVLTDPLPNASGLSWSIAAGSPTLMGVTGVTCAIATANSGQRLTCGTGPGSTGAFSLAAGQSVSVHVMSPTTSSTPAGQYTNTATATATNKSDRHRLGHRHARIVQGHRAGVRQQ